MPPSSEARGSHEAQSGAEQVSSASFPMDEKRFGGLLQGRHPG